MGLKKIFPFLGLLFATVSFGGGINLPQPYKGLVEKLIPAGGEVDITYFGGNFKAIVKEKTSKGVILTNISSDDFVSFYSELYETFRGVKPAEVSVKIKTPAGVVPYNPFYEVWDMENNLKLLKFSRLKPGCKPPIVELEGKTVSGIKVFIPSEEIYKKLFEGGFKKPSYYCY
jgi:hypothetical protein